MKDNRVDSHKLIFHPRQVADWLEGKQMYPIFLEVGISGACNHRCVFCCVSHMNHEPTFLDTDVLLEQYRVLSKVGLKSTLLAGNGEPTLHKDFSKIVHETKKLGIDVAISTNGVLFTKDKMEECLGDISWVRFSVSGGTEETYDKIHCGKPGDLQKVFDNIQCAAKLKKEKGLTTTLGVQIVATPETKDEVLILAKKVKELGADLFTVKTVGYTPLSTQYKEDIKSVIEDKNDKLEDDLKKLCDSQFSAIYRVERTQAYLKERTYKECHASPFYACIDSDGIVYPCCNLLGIEEMSLGSIYKEDMIDIWNGNRRKNVMRGLSDRNLIDCVPACRLHKMNEYLEELKNPGEHVNFI